MPAATAEDLAAWKERCGLGGDDVLVVGVYSESDAGLADAERLRGRLGVPCRDEPAVSDARRHKHLMLEAVERRAGLTVARHKLCASAGDARDYARGLLHSASGSRRVVVKPFRGVGSESVYRCDSVDEVQAAWEAITATQVYGAAERHATVLVQEFLDGAEYAVDVVSRDGAHKVVALWRYVKQPANGASFCYFRTELIDATMDSAVDDICRYVASSLTALGVRWGVSHSEVIIPKDDDRGPMLIEVNCRQHNMDFLPIVMACVGYNALDLTLAAMFGGGDEWSEIPDQPTLRAYGCMVHLVNYAAGPLTQNFHLQEMVDLPSVYDCEVYPDFCTPGCYITPTVDIRTDAGWAQLINEDRDDLQRDYEQIVAWMPTMFETQSDGGGP